MIKTITIGDIDVKLSNNIGWAMVYRSQFGHDIMPTIIPLVASAIDLVKGIVSTAEDGTVSVEDLLSLTDDETFFNALVHLSGFEMVELINILWALAKTADNSIDEPERWVSQFDIFPLDDIVPEVFNLITMGVVSSKNWTRLKGLRAKLTIQPSN